jgi:c-di-GMP-related signal transduction protein
MPFGLDSRHVVSIARQPILDLKARVFGYQLLYEHGPAPLDPVDAPAASAFSTRPAIGLIP